MLILWLLFFGGYFGWAIKLTLSFTVWIVIYIIILVLTLSLLISWSGESGSGSKSSGGSTLVPCTSTASATPATIDGWTASIFSQAVDSNSYTDTGVRSFSIKDLDAKTGQDMYYRLAKADKSSVTGVKGLIEVCDANNMTKKYESTKDSTTTPAGENAMAVIYYLHGNHKVQTPGAYRIDAYANVDGSWKLVNREAGVQFTE